MNEAANDPVGEFVDACIGDAARARVLAAADPSLLKAQWRGDPLLHWADNPADARVARSFF